MDTSLLLAYYLQLASKYYRYQPSQKSETTTYAPILHGRSTAVHSENTSVKLGKTAMATVSICSYEMYCTILMRALKAVIAE